MVDKVVSRSVDHACSLQGWYLSPELVSLALFDLLVTMKAVMAEKLQRFVRRTIITFLEKQTGAAFGKTIFPKVEFSSELVDFIDRDPAFFFSSLGISTDFLSKPVADWQRIPSTRVVWPR